MALSVFAVVMDTEQENLGVSSTYILVFFLIFAEVLPLVQFEPAEGITFEEALDLIERAPLPESTLADNTEYGAEVLRIDHDVDSTDPFLDKVDEVSAIECTS